MNDCVNGDIRDALPDLVNGTLPANEAARIQAHVQQCADCAAEVGLLRTARAAMHLAPTMDTMRIASAVQTSTAQRLASRRAPARVTRMAGVSLIVLLGIVGLWATRTSSPAGPESLVAAGGATNVQSGPDRARAAEARLAQAPTQLALGGDMSQLEDEQLLALLDEVSELEAMPGEEPASLAIEPLMPVDQEDLR